MQLSELFDLSLRVYRTLGWRILVASAVPTLFSLAGLTFLVTKIFPGFVWTKLGTSQFGQATDAAVNMVLGVLVAGPLILIGVSLATTYIAPLVADFMHGLPPDYKAAGEAQWKTAPRMLLVSIRESLIASSGAVVGGALLFLSWYINNITSTSDSIAGLVLVVGIFALVIGGVLALVLVSTHALVAPITVLEKVGAAVAARRSRDLMKARPYHGSGYDSVWTLYLLVAFLAGIIMAGASAITAILGVSSWAAALDLRAWRPIIESAINLLPIYVTLWVTVPVWAVTVTIVYSNEESVWRDMTSKRWLRTFGIRTAKIVFALSLLVSCITFGAGDPEAQLRLSTAGPPMFSSTF